MFRHSFTTTHRFPIWQFLNQPVFHPEIKLKLNPNEFWNDYQIELLERCWEMTYQQNRYPQA